MIPLDYDKHINQIKPEKWEKLFAILPQIKSEVKFGELVMGKSPKDGVFHFPYYVPSKVIFDFLHIFEELKLNYPEYLGNWEFGKNVLQQKEYEFTNLDVTTLCKLLNVIIVSDRFCEGYLIGKFSDGTITSVIEAIKFQNNITLNWNLEFNKKNELVKLYSKDNFVIPSKSSIFIYGSPGSGKTELSKNIIISLYKKLESSIVIITESSEYEVFNNFNGIRFIKDKKNLNHLVNILDH